VLTVEQVRSKTAKKQYIDRKRTGLCVTCGSSQIVTQTHCDDCRIKNIWKNFKKADDKSFASISVSLASFVVWYKAKRELSGGLCEWCKEPFGKRGPVADHDHTTGDPRALICTRCNTVEGFGLARLKKVIAGIEAWTSGKPTTRQNIPFEVIESCFPRWYGFVTTGSDQKKRLIKVEEEIKTHCTSFAELDDYMYRFRVYMEEQDALSKKLYRTNHI